MKQVELLAYVNHCQLVLKYFMRIHMYVSRPISLYIYVHICLLSIKNNLKRIKLASNWNFPVEEWYVHNILCMQISSTKFVISWVHIAWSTFSSQPFAWTNQNSRICFERKWLTRVAGFERIFARRFVNPVVCNHVDVYRHFLTGGFCSFTFQGICNYSSYEYRELFLCSVLL